MRPVHIVYEIRDEHPAPEVGDVLWTSRSGYLVLSSRAMSTLNGSRKFDLSVVRYSSSADAVLASPRTAPTLHQLVWNKRARRRA